MTAGVFKIKSTGRFIVDASGRRKHCTCCFVWRRLVRCVGATPEQYYMLSTDIPNVMDKYYYAADDLCFVVGGSVTTLPEGATVFVPEDVEVENTNCCVCAFCVGRPRPTPAQVHVAISGMTTFLPNDVMCWNCGNQSYHWNWNPEVHLDTIVRAPSLAMSVQEGPCKWRSAPPDLGQITPISFITGVTINVYGEPGCAPPLLTNFYAFGNGEIFVQKLNATDWVVRYDCPGGGPLFVGHFTTEAGDCGPFSVAGISNELSCGGTETKTFCGTGGTATVTIT